jgi:hypothetical protein
VTVLGNANIFMGHKYCMYLFSGDRIRRFDTVFGNIEFETQAPNTANPGYALSFYDTILVFSPVEGDSGVEETSVIPGARTLTSGTCCTFYHSHVRTWRASMTM